MMWLEGLVLKFGLTRVIGAGVLLLLLLAAGGYVGWNKIHVAFLQHQDTKHVAQRDQARAETKVARKDEAQVTRASEIAATTTTAQDHHTAATRAATVRSTEAIHERIRQAPVAPAAAPADDPVVRDAVDQALARAQAAADRLQGTSGR